MQGWCILFSLTVDYSLNLDTCSGSAEEAENYLFRPLLCGVFVYLSLYMCMCMFVYSVLRVMLFLFFVYVFITVKSYKRHCLMCVPWPARRMCLCAFCHRSHTVWRVSTACVCMDLCLYQYMCMCSLVAQPASWQALGLLTAPLLPVKHENSPMCERRVAVGVIAREQKDVWSVCTYVCVY